MSSPAQLVLACNVADFNATTGECAAPYYTQVPTFVPSLSAVQGAKIGFAIVLIWTLGLIARLVIRAGQQEHKQ